MPLRSSYDYILAGAGCAGLSLLVHLIRSGQANGKNILVIDEAAKNSNDRTWCFWETGKGPFEDVVYRRWDKVWFHGIDYSRLLALSPYEYKLIRGIDFYNYCHQLISTVPGIEWVKASVTDIKNDQSGNPQVRIEGNIITAAFVFSSISLGKPVLKKKDIMLLQHFRGWVVKTETPVFDTAAATLMDFRVKQDRGTTFVYVMPFSPTEALVEYTLFTASLLTTEEYEEGLKQYMDDYYPGVVYEIKETEQGVIPMTNYQFQPAEDRIIYIGTHGGDTKASSGYTFQFIQKRCQMITDALRLNKLPRLQQPGQPWKFRFYDSVLLQVLDTGKLSGASIFSRMFKKNTAPRILRFLDNDSSLTDDLHIISSFPVMPFFQAAMRQLL